MTRYTSTPSKKIRTIVQLLIVAMMTAVIVAITACSGKQPPPTHRPQNEDRSPIQTIEAMAAEIAALQTKAAEPTEITVDDGRRPTEEPSTAVAPATATATATPAPTATLPTPSGRGICSRTPEIQKLILSTLGLTSCRSVTSDELYRITYFTDRPVGGSKVDWIKFPLKPGDLNGLVNLKELEITGNFTIQPSTFAGSGITHLKLEVKGVEQGAFDGTHIEHMSLDTDEMLPKGTLPTSLQSLSLDTPEKPPKGTLPTSLRSLSMRFKAPEQVMERDELEELVNLEQLSLSMYRYDDLEELAKALGGHEQLVYRIGTLITDIEFNLPTGMLEGNSKLKSVAIGGAAHGGQGGGRAYVSVENALVAELEELESIWIENLKTRDYLSGDPPLSLHPSSPLHHFLNNPNVSEWDDSKQRWKNWNYGEKLSAHT